jgi:ATP-binding cassette subfamily C protein
MRLLLTLLKAYPWRSTIALLAILLGGIADGVSITALLPLLNIIIRKTPAGTQPAADSSGMGSGIEEFFLDALAFLGLEATLGTLLVVVVLGVITKSLLLLAANTHVGYSAAHIATDLRLSLLRTVLASRWEYFLHQPIGKLTNSMANEAKRSSSSYIYGITLLAFVIQSIVYATIALAMSWRATLTIFVIGMVIFSFSHLFVRMSKRAGKRQTIVSKTLISLLSDTLQSVKSLKAMAREELADSVLSAETSKLNRVMHRQVLSQELLNAIQAPLFAIVIAGGIYLALDRWEMQFATVMVLVVLLSRVLNQLGKIQKTYQKMVTQESAFWSLRRTIKEASKAGELTTGMRQPKLESGIRFERVSFGYGDKQVLQDLSLLIPTRSLTTIIGPSGTGKTTLIDLVIGLYRPDSGTIYLDDVPLTEVDMKQWRQMLGYVPQEHILLHDSVLTNVTFGDPQLTAADAEQALQAAGAWDFVRTLPQGMQSSVGERGSKLSGGQRQRIMIARALAHRPQVLILDEPTSALDPESEATIGNTLRRLRENYTILVISHQTALAELANQTYLLEDGRLVPGAGSPDPGSAAGAV